MPRLIEWVRREHRKAQDRRRPALPTLMVRKSLSRATKPYLMVNRVLFGAPSQGTTRPDGGLGRFEGRWSYRVARRPGQSKVMVPPGWSARTQQFLRPITMSGCGCRRCEGWAAKQRSTGVGHAERVANRLLSSPAGWGVICSPQHTCSPPRLATSHEKRTGLWAGLLSDTV